MSARKTLSGICAIYLLFFTVSGSGKTQEGGMEDQGPKVLYRTKCASCHGIDGSAGTAIGKNLKAKDLRAEETQKMSDEKIYQVITEGRGKMPPFKKSLGEDKCRQLVGYIRGLAKKD